MVALIVLFISTLVTYSLQTNSNENFYWAAVVEYHGLFDNNLTATENCIKNAQSHAKIIKEAKNNVTDLDIIVFPELGLMTHDHTLFIEVPDPADKVIPAMNSSSHEVLKIISEAAQSNKVFVVVNLHELYKNGTKEYKYNTNVVLNRKGEVIARYRKYNLFGERYLNKLESPTYVTFDTDFGVKFGTFICFDIIFEQPAMGLLKKENITDVVFPSAWFSELPFHISVQEQSAWAYATNVNLLASGYNNLSVGNTGSGIYAGRKGPIVFTQTVTGKSEILIGKVPKFSTTMQNMQGYILNNEGNNSKKMESPPILQENVKVFQTELIEPEKMMSLKDENITVETNGTKVQALKSDFKLEKKLCHNELCCNFNLNFTVQYYQDGYNFKGDESFNKSNAFYHYRYRLVAFDGIRNYIVGNSSGQQLCAIMPCLNDTLDSCAKVQPGAEPTVKIIHKDFGNLTLYSTEFSSINISGEFHNNRVLFLPSVVLSQNGSLELLNQTQFQFNVKNLTDKSFVNLIIPNTVKFGSGGILTRLFERDNRNSNSANILQGYSVLLGLVPLIIYIIHSRLS